MQKPKLLIWADPPVHEDGSLFCTGHGKILYNILPILQKQFSTMQIGISLSAKQYQYKGHHITNIVSNDRDYWGFETFNAIVGNADKANKPDIVLTITDCLGDGNNYSRHFQQYITQSGIPYVSWIAMAENSFDHGYVDFVMSCNHLIGMADYTKVITLEELPFLEKKITTLYPPVSSCFKKPIGDERNKLREEFDWGDKKVLLLVSKNQKRKNIPIYFELIKRLPAEYHLMMIVSSVRKSSNNPNVFDGWNLESLHRSAYADLGSRININNGKYVELYGMPDEELAKYYKAADATLLLSGNEGLGVPVLESMACGTPSVVSQFGPLQELAADDRGMIVNTERFDFSLGATPRLSTVPGLDDAAIKIREVCENSDKSKLLSENGLKFIEMINDESRLSSINDILMDAYETRNHVVIEPDMVL